MIKNAIRKTIAMILAVSAIFTTTAFAAANEKAPAVVDEAVQLNITDDKDNDFSAELTRLEFCEYTYNMLNAVKELPVAKLAESPFADTSSYKVNALAFVGIATGCGNRVFEPNRKITREEAAVVLCRAARYAGIETPFQNGKIDVNYSDNSEISPWALSYVYSMKLLGIFGTENAPFRPLDGVTKIETFSALISINKLANE